MSLVCVSRIFVSSVDFGSSHLQAKSRIKIFESFESIWVITEADKLNSHLRRWICKGSKTVNDVLDSRLWTRILAPEGVGEHIDGQWSRSRPEFPEFDLNFQSSTVLLQDVFKRGCNVSKSSQETLSLFANLNEAGDFGIIPPLAPCEAHVDTILDRRVD